MKAIIKEILYYYWYIPEKKIKLLLIRNNQCMTMSIIIDYRFMFYDLDPNI